MLIFYTVCIVWGGFKTFLKYSVIHLGLMLIVGAVMLMVVYYMALVSVTLTPSKVVEVEVLEQYFSGGGGRFRGGSCIKWKVRFADGSESTHFCINKSITMTSPTTIARVRLTQAWIADKIYHLPLEDHEI